MKVIGIIPVRMGSTRFPGKPLANIHGIPMVGHVYGRGKKAKLLDEIYIATCDQEIIDYSDSIGANSILTSKSHNRASERTEEALKKIEDDKNKVDIIVMLQGDEPLINPRKIDQAVESLVNDSKASVVNVMQPITSEEEFNSDHTVKIVTDRNGIALYFSREPIPSNKMYNKKIRPFKQTGLIAFKRNSLIQFCKFEPSILEIIESIDMNRFLENGVKVKMILEEESTLGVDIEEQIKIVEDNYDWDLDYEFLK